MIAKVHNVTATSSVCEESLEAEMMRFRTQQNLGLETDPLQWWAGHRNLYPRLAITAKKYLCVAATSVASERVFSKSSALLTKFRASLSDEHVDELVFLMKNKEYVVL